MALGLQRLCWLTPEPIAAAAAPAAYTDFRDLYRAKWRWDAVVRGTHTSANCVSSCAWNLYVREGVIWREEQSPPYAASNASVPDWNPRGCQKGGSCSDRLQSASRLVHPLRRAGARGEGRWKRVSWDEALGEIADQLVDTPARRRGEGAVLELGPNVDFGANTAAAPRVACPRRRQAAVAQAHRPPAALSGLPVVPRGRRGACRAGSARVANGDGAFRAHAKVSPALAPGQAVVYHAWEPYPFAGWRGNIEMIASPYKALRFAGGYGHLRPRAFFSGPVHVPRGVSVEIALDDGASSGAARA
ncbi:MAG: hypothetical protein DCC71_11835 [Proteobacteria bacterium]|nr:MAG: hypothetical protein DCC71_11835 [Pseudomonadota bacterium]